MGKCSIRLWEAVVHQSRESNLSTSAQLNSVLAADGLGGQQEISQQPLSTGSGQCRVALTNAIYCSFHYDFDFCFFLSLSFFFPFVFFSHFLNNEHFRLVLVPGHLLDLPLTSHFWLVSCRQASQWHPLTLCLLTLRCSSLSTVASFCSKEATKKDCSLCIYSVYGT